MKLTAANVHQVALDCLFTEDEPLFPRIEVDGVVSRMGFKPSKIDEHYDDIVSMLQQLPDPFQQSIGGGWSFLQGCMTKDDEQWGEQPDVGLLFCLGIAAGRGVYPLPRTMWYVLPGNVPYFMVTDKRVAATITTDTNEEVKS